MCPHRSTCSWSIRLRFDSVHSRPSKPWKRRTAEKTDFNAKAQGRKDARHRQASQKSPVCHQILASWRLGVLASWRFFSKLVNVRDFVALARRYPRHGGMTLAAQSGWTVSGLIGTLDRILSRTEGEDWVGRVRWLNGWEQGAGVKPFLSDSSTVPPRRHRSVHISRSLDPRPRASRPPRKGR